MKNVTLLTSVLLCALLTSGCAANRQLETRVVWSTSCIGDVQATEANRSLFLGAVAVAIVPKLIDGAVDAAATALKQAGERAELARSTGHVLSQPYAVSSEADLIVSPEHSCLIVARGKFAPPAPASDSERPTGIQAIAELKDYVLIYQAKVQALKGEPYFQLVPFSLRVGTFEGSSFWSPKHRDFNIAVSLTTPGSEKPFASTVFTFENIPEGLNEDASSWQLVGKTSAPLPLPPLPESGKKAQAKQEAFVAPYILAESVHADLAKPQPPRPELPSNPLASTNVQSKIKTLCKAVRTYNRDYPKIPVSEPQCTYAATLARADVDTALLAAQSSEALHDWANTICPPPQTSKKPCGDDLERPVTPQARFGYMVMNASIVESRQGNKFAAFLGQALGAAKDDIVKATTQEIIPSQRQAIEDAKDAAERSAHRAVILADLTVTQSEQKLTELLATENAAPAPSDITQARASLIKAKISANDAYRSANLPLPYPELH